MNTDKIFIGVMAGLAAGIVIGILVAPEKGSVTIKKITGKAIDYADELKEILTDGVKTITDKVENITDNANNLIEQSLFKKDNTVYTERNNGNHNHQNN